MKRSILSAMALGAVLVAVPLCASAETNTTVDAFGTGAICGHIDVDPMRVVALSYENLPANSALITPIVGQTRFIEVTQERGL